MTIDELKDLLTYAGTFSIGGVVFLGVAWMFLKSYIPSYISRKAENLATREDIAGITHEIESVKAQYAVLIEDGKAKHQLRMAALDRRLQAHQEAFTLWRGVLGAVHTEEIGKVVLECQEWWEKNCLYLEPKVRDTFVAAYSAAHTHHAYAQARADKKLLAENWEQITKFPNVLFEAIQLPPLIDAEKIIE